MNFYQPNLLLIRNELDEYILYSTIYWNSINFQTSGNTVSEHLDDNLVSVELIITEDSSFLPKWPDQDFELIHPLVHLINLGKLEGTTLSDSDELSATIEATIIIEDPANPGVRRRGERGSVGTISAGGSSRPFKIAKK